MQTNFSRSNVNERTLSISSPNRSSFNLSRLITFTPELGRLHPVLCEPLMPASVVDGGLSPKLQMEKLITPTLGRTRLDTHTFAVNFRRINKDFLTFVEYQGQRTGRNSQATLPSYNLLSVMQRMIVFFGNMGQVDLPASYSQPTNLSSIYYSADTAPSDVRSLIHFDLNAISNKELRESLLSYVSSSDVNPLGQVLRFLALRSDLSGYYLNYLVALRDYPRLVYLAAAAAYDRLAYSDYAANQYGYCTDFYVQEISRLLDLAESPSIGIGVSVSDFLTRPWINVFQPFFGINSIHDYIGYPIFRQYSSFNEFSDVVISDPSVDMRMASVGDVFISTGSFPSVTRIWAFARLLTINAYDPSSSVQFNVYQDGSETLFFNSSDFPFDRVIGQQGYMITHAAAIFQIVGDLEYTLPDPDTQTVAVGPKWTMDNVLPILDDSWVCPEMPVRAVYAAWYDRFRDWHIESKENVLNPDTFGAGSVLLNNMPSMEGYVNFNWFNIVCQLLVTKWRYYSRDALMTIQTDDIYRHVYLPVFGEVRDGVTSVGAEGDVDKAISRITDIVIDSVQTAFPSGSFDSRSGDVSLWTALRADLQNMRRTSMVEKWLARNFFYPDNYAGQLQAHWDISPSDINILFSEYLGGKESMLSGEQQVSNVSTDQMPAGTRTLVAGGNLSDGFTFRASDFTYIVSFCSIVPLVMYDKKNSHMHELRYQDMPFSEYSQDSRVTIKLRDMLRGFSKNTKDIGYVPRYYQYRTALDEVHGRYLTDLRSYDWFRDWYNMTFVDASNANKSVHGFSLHPYAMRVHLPLDSFLGLAPWDSIAFGTVDIRFTTDVPLSAAVEFI